MGDAMLPRPTINEVYLERLTEPYSELRLLGVGAKWHGPTSNIPMTITLHVDGVVWGEFAVNTTDHNGLAEYHVGGQIPCVCGEKIEVYLKGAGQQVRLVERKMSDVIERPAVVPEGARPRYRHLLSLLAKQARAMIKGRWLTRAGRSEFKEDLQRFKQAIRTRQLRGRYPARSPHQGYIAHTDPTSAMLDAMRDQSKLFAYRPKISILMPVYNVEPKWLEIAIESVYQQVYDNWELCLADDASTLPALKKYLDQLVSDPRIEIIRRPKNGHISAASNSAGQAASGTFIALLDHDDCLAPHALFEIVQLLQKHPEADVIYSDEDKISEDGERYDPQFKPDWSREMFMAYNYLNHFTCMRRALFEKVGRFRLGYEGSQDHDLLLRVVSETDRVFHIPKILYHWRSLPTSTAAAAMVKPWVHTSGRKALEDYLYRQRIDALPYRPPIAEKLGIPINLLEWPDAGESVAIVIRAGHNVPQLKRCLDSILTNTTYQNYQVYVGVVTDDNLVRAYLEVMQDTITRIHIILTHSTTPAASYNEMVSRLDEAFVVFVDHALEVIEPRWLTRMVGYATIPGVGVTGASLVSRDGVRLHAGIVLGMRDGTAPAHAFHGLPVQDTSYYFQAEIVRNVSAVSGRCLLTRRKLFDQVQGFDAANFPETMFDIDYSLRIEEHEMRTLYVGSAELADPNVIQPTRDHDRCDSPMELRTFRRIYGRRIDSYYNPNLSEGRTYQLACDGPRPHDPPAYGRPLRALVVAHNLNNPEGAPRYLSEIVLGLQKRGVIDTQVWSPLPGRGGDVYTQVGIPVHVATMPESQRFVDGQWTRNGYEAVQSQAMAHLRQTRPDVVIVNTLVSFPMVEAAARLGIPTVWIIHESYSAAQRAVLFSEVGRARCEAAFQWATRVVPASHDTTLLFDELDRRGNRVVLHNGLLPDPFDDYIHRVSRKAAAAHLPGGPNRKHIITVGTVCERKGQHTLVEAAALLRDRADFVCHLVGAREGIPYTSYVRHLIAHHQLESHVLVVPETDQVSTYFRGADIFVCTSHMETFSRAVLEAEAFGLPLVTTPCQGIAEQVHWGQNALRFERNDATALATHLAKLLDDDALRQSMGEKSRAAFDNHLTYDEMLDRYARVIQNASREQWKASASQVAKSLNERNQRAA